MNIRYLLTLLMLIWLVGCGESNNTSSYNNPVPMVEPPEPEADLEPLVLKEIPNFNDSGDRARQPQIAYADNRFLVVSCMPKGNNGKIFYGMLLSEKGEILKSIDISPPFDLTRIIDDCEDEVPALSYHNGQFLVAYRQRYYSPDSENPPPFVGAYHKSGIFAHRIDLDGNILDVDGISISVKEDNGIKYDPDIAFSGENYLISYTSGRNIKATLLSQEGNVLKNIDLPLYDADSLPKVVWDGENFILAWVRYAWYSGDIYAIKISSSGEVVNAPPLLIRNTESWITSFDLDIDNRGKAIVSWGNPVPAIATNIFSKYFVMPFPDFNSSNYEEPIMLWDEIIDSWDNNGKVVIKSLESGFEIYYFDINYGLISKIYDPQSNQLKPMVKHNFPSYYVGPWQSDKVGNLNIAFGRTNALAVFNGWFPRYSLASYLLE